MDDSLTLSGGGSTAVATDELFADAVRLGGTVSVASDWRERARVIHVGLAELDLSEPAAGPWDTTSPTWGIAMARTHLYEAMEYAGRLRKALVESAERYGAAEGVIEALWRMSGGPLAWLVGSAAVTAVPAIVIGGGAAIGAHALGWRTPLETWLAGQRHVLSDPDFVRAVRTAMDSADEFIGGVFRLPGAMAIGSEIRAPESASLLLGVAGLLGVAYGSRVLVDGPVRVSPLLPDGRADRRAGHQTARAEARPFDGSVTAPAGIADLLDRIPTSDAAAQIRVERYGAADDPRWVVYIGGTVDFTTTAGAQTNDMTNNLHGIADDSALDALRVAGADSGAVERAVRLALTEAGAKPGDPLIPIGHSGGGTVAATLAGDPELNVVAAVSAGGPVASAELREGVPLLSVEHEEDLVPATGGWGHPSPDRLTVSRSVLEPGVEYDDVLPAHQLVRYRETAELIDASEEQRLVEFREQLAEFTGGGTGEMTQWVARRELSPSTPDAAPGR
ncbi:hypothetical protein ASE14_11615 [Agromyces sp. Root81]|uniref:hypothetical protein n=1 Tax=Agromyces sp. Root81 TaxID=1736601 RepID=UPI0006F6DE41|nr:hypothetical protein [Agromyces sp. Root81]KRC61502.1 hypothetical protein ASE14_11615 [Agromyces sp. Root81]